jgi:hypothetical protein
MSLTTLRAAILIVLATAFTWAFRVWTPPWWVRDVDVYAFWTFGRFPVAHIYDAAALCAYQHVSYCLPFFYPPPALFVFKLMALLPYPWAGALWTAGSLVLFLSYFAPRQWPLILAAPLVVPCWHGGQMGFFCAAILLYGLRLVDLRSAWAGVVLGVLVVKPQYALMLPVILMARREYRPLFVAGTAAGALCFASLLIFGAAAWRGFFQVIGGATHQGGFGFSVAIVTHSTVLQLLTTAAVAAIVWRKPTTEVALVATLLASPYVRPYDTPVLMPVILRLRPIPQAVLYLAPYLVVVLYTYGAGVLWLAAVFVTVLREGNLLHEGNLLGEGNLVGTGERSATRRYRPGLADYVPLRRLLLLGPSAHTQPLPIGASQGLHVRGGTRIGGKPPQAAQDSFLDRTVQTQQFGARSGPELARSPPVPQSVGESLRFR